MRGNWPGIAEEQRIVLSVHLKKPWFGVYCGGMVALMQDESEENGLFHCLFDAEIPAELSSG
jgi:hypothetical protein